MFQVRFLFMLKEENVDVMLWHSETSHCDRIKKLPPPGRT